MPPAKIPKSPKTSLEYRERAFTAASRRSDRSLEARMDSARKASEVHKQRTGRSLNITEEAVANEEMYEEIDDRIYATNRQPLNIFIPRQIQPSISPGSANNLLTNANRTMGQQQIFQPDQNQMVRPGGGMAEFMAYNQTMQMMPMPTVPMHSTVQQHQQPSLPMMQFMNSQQTMQMIPDTDQEFYLPLFNYTTFQSPKPTQQWNIFDQTMNMEKGVNIGNGNNLFDTNSNGEFDSWFDFNMGDETLISPSQ